MTAWAGLSLAVAAGFAVALWTAERRRAREERPEDPDLLADPPAAEPPSGDPPSGDPPGGAPS